jgi:hypothetical protein
MYEFDPDLVAAFEEAEASVEPWLVGIGPLEQELSTGIAEPLVGAAGYAAAQHFTMDRYFSSPLRRVLAYAGGAWRHRGVTATEEAGLVQVAMAADQIYVCWNDSNQLTLVRCLKAF